MIPPATSVLDMQPMNQNLFYQALLNRDQQFDGLFFAGVQTTGVYCRCICPARKPLLKNVSFFLSRQAAEQAGFRPCLRCRPETEKGTPAWMGTSATVSRGLKLLLGSFGEDLRMTDLSEKLGMSDRRLRQLFQEHLGASPWKVSLQKRLELAEKLILQTNKTFTEIAFCSGFKSIRRFNDAVKKQFGKSPKMLRKE